MPGSRGRVESKHVDTPAVALLTNVVSRPPRTVRQEPDAPSRRSRHHGLSGYGYALAKIAMKKPTYLLLFFAAAALPQVATKANEGYKTEEGREKIAKADLYPFGYELAGD